MEKGLKIVRAIAIVLIAILISVIAFCGLYVKKYGIWENVIPDFKLGMELDGFRELHYVLDDKSEEKEVFVDANGKYAGTVKEENTDSAGETENGETPVENQEAEPAEEVNVDSEYKKETRTIKANEDENINIENFEKSKNIIQKRLEKMSSNEYNIRQDSVTGEIVVEVPDDDNIGEEEFLISTVGRIEITDYQTGLILMDNSKIKTASVIGSNNNQYQAYLQLNFTPEGSEILKKISKEYVKSTNEAGEEKTTYVSISLDDQVFATTYFGEELTAGVIQVPMGNATQNYDEYIEYARNAERIANMINGEKMPLSYKLSSDNFVKSNIIENYWLIAVIVSAIIIVIISIYMIIRFKLNGLKAAILSIGYIALLTIVCRYTNVFVTMNSLIAFIVTIIINYAFNFKFLNNLKETEDRKLSLGKAMKELYLSIIPVCIIAVIFTFMSSVVISSIGMTLFWGLLVQAIYDGILYML